MNEPLNFSSNRNHDLLSRLTQSAAAAHFKLNQVSGPKSAPPIIDENANIADREKSPYSDRRNAQTAAQKEQKRIDKIAETLRSAGGGKNFFEFPQAPKGSCPPMIPHSPPTSMALKPPTFPPVSNFPAHFMADDSPMTRTPENLMFESQSSLLGENAMCGDATLMEKPAAAMPKASNPKLYATCFICNKKLSNQYNLRVHLETHQNMR